MNDNINDLINRFNKYLNESNIDYKHRQYLSWKKKNVTLRGTNNVGGDNNGMASYGRGLYTAFLSNKELARKFGKVYFLINAIPKKPKVVNTVNDAEMWFQNLVFKYCKQHGKDYDPSFFHKHTDIPTEMKKLGYDGFVIKGREMVNYFPPDNVIYFENERQLEHYFETVILD